jgi:hypothetical protein
MSLMMMLMTTMVTIDDALPRHSPCRAGRAATALLACCERDRYVDAGLPASHYGAQYLYKVLVPLDPSNNRSVEVTATLLDANNTVLRTFILRGHGYRDQGSANPPWPDFGDGDVGLNDLSSDGATVSKPAQRLPFGAALLLRSFDC